MPWTLRAGIAQATITPPVGLPLAGFAGRGVSTDVHDELTATVLFAESAPSGAAAEPPTRIVLIGCDLISMGEALTQRIRRAVAAATAVPAGNVVVCCSHTHYGPAGVLDAQMDPTQRLVDADGTDHSAQLDSYFTTMVNVLAGAGAAAARRSQPCHISFGESTADLGVNRRERRPDGQIILGRNPEGPRDRRVAVVRIDSVDRGPIGTIVNFACHGVSLGGHCTEVSADFPGVARQLIERETESPCLFIQGAAGNINPILMGWDWTNPMRLGTSLGAAALDAYWSLDNAEPAEPAPLASAAARLELPPLLPASVETGEEAVAELEKQWARLSESGSSGELHWCEARLRRARRGLAHRRGITAAPVVSAEIVALRLGSEIGLVTVPAEPFTELGLSVIRQSPFAHLLYAGYANGMIGYLPTRAAHGEGGYEVTHLCNVDPAAAEIVEGKQLRLLGQLA